MPKNTKLTTTFDQKPDKDYKNLLEELRSILSENLYKAYKAVDNIKVQAYWQLGERIVREELKREDRADYGKYLINNLSVDLGIKKRRLYEIVKFYRCYEIVRSVTAQLSWTHYVCLIDIENEKERKFYEQKSIIHSWSVRELKKQIKNRLYKKTTPKEVSKTIRTKLPAIHPQEIFKNTYHFNFMELQASEKKFEQKIIQNIENFLKELGGDFTFLGRQVPIKIGRQTHYIDMVLFHKGIPCTVLVDFKIGKLDSRDIGQMNKYVSYYRQNRQYAYENDSIGLIICREADSEEVVYALADLEQKIFIAKYKVKLPSENKIKKIIHKL